MQNAKGRYMNRACNKAYAVPQPSRAKDTLSMLPTNKFQWLTQGRVYPRGLPLPSGYGLTDETPKYLLEISIATSGLQTRTVPKVCLKHAKEH